MVDRKPNHKQTSRVESSVTADSVRARFQKSDILPGFPSIGSFPVEDRFRIETRPDGAESGVRAVPGDKGFLYADTPSATVFLGKKQWISDTWTYLIDEEDSEELNGRFYETLKRDILERVITRKIQWLSDHESFTKLKSRLNIATQFGKISEDLKQQLQARLDSNDPSSLTQNDLDILLDLEIVPSGLGIASTTRYYTTPLTVGDSDSSISQYTRKLQQLRQLERFAGPDQEDVLNTVVENQVEFVRSLQATINSLTSQINKLDANRVLIESKLQADEIFGTDPETGKVIILQDELEKINTLLRNYIVERDSKQSALEDAEVLLEEYKERQSSDTSVEDLRKEVATLKEQAREELANLPRLVPLNSFNGIIEFNNITSVNTSISINGQGTATISMENPNNILRISRDDLILALSEDPYLEQSLNGETKENIPTTLHTEWTQAGDSLDNLVSSNSVNLNNSGNLVFWRGRYYDPAGLQTVLQNTTDRDARTGFTNSEISALLTEYKKQQSSIYKEIQTRILALPVIAQEGVTQEIRLPTITSALDSYWLESHRNALAALLENVSVSDLSEESPSYDIIDSYIQGLKEQESQLAPILSFKPANSETTDADDNEVGKPETSDNKKPSSRADYFQAINSLKRVLKQAESRPTQALRFFRELQNHFTGKYVVEVADRVWVWLSSPSKTIQIDNDGFGMVESVIGRAASELKDLTQQRLKEKIQQLVDQAEAVHDSVAAKEEELNSLRFAESGSDASTLPIRTAREQQLEREVEAANTQLNILRQEYFRLTDEYARIENEAEPFREREGTEKKEKSLNEDNFSPDAVGTATGTVPLSGVQLSTFGGLEEQQFQVFEGVITQVTGTFDGQYFTLNAQCKDLTYYLEQTRVMERPSLSNRDTIALLNDPIYRKLSGTAQDIDCTSRFRGLDENQDGEIAKDAQGHPLAGRWKSGLYVTTAQIYNTSTRETALLAEELGQTEEDVSCIHGLSVYSKLYAGLDSANLISLLTTGIPFNFSLYTLNLAQIGRLYRTNERGELVPDPANPFEVLRGLVGNQNRLLGNFQPFLELNQTYSKETLISLQEDLDRLRSVLRQRLSTRATRPNRGNDKAGYTDAFGNAIVALAEGRVSQTEPVDPTYEGVALTATATVLEEELQRGRVQQSKIVDKNDTRNTESQQSGLQYIRERIESQGYSLKDEDIADKKGDRRRLRIFTIDQERKWKQHFEQTFPSISSVRSARRTEARERISNLNSGLSSLQAALQDTNNSLNQPDLDVDFRAGLQERAAELQTEIESVESQIQEEEQVLSQNPSYAEGAGLDLQTSITLDVEEVRAFIAFAEAIDRFNSYRELYNQFVVTTAEAIGLTDEEGEATTLSTALTKKYNRSAIIPTKRKIIEKRKLNFLLINDDYVTNVNLKPYQLRISRANTSEVWRSVYTNSFALCREAARLVDFEFYCDENGHLRFKPPTYNRILKEHLDLDAFRPELSVQLKAQFPNLENLQLTLLAKQLLQAVSFERDETRRSLSLQASALGIATPVGSGSLDSQQEIEAFADVAGVTDTIRTAANLLYSQELPGPGSETSLKQQDSLPSALVTRQMFKDDLEILSPSSDAKAFRDAQGTFQEYVEAYERALRAANREIEKIISEESVTIKNSIDNGLRDEYHRYYERLQKCEEAPSSCQDVEGSPFKRDAEGFIVPPRVNPEDYEDESKRPKTLSTTGADVLTLIQEIDFNEIPESGTFQQSPVNDFSSEKKNKLITYLKAASERRLTNNKRKTELNPVGSPSVPSQANDLPGMVPTAYAYVNRYQPINITDTTPVDDWSGERLEAIFLAGKVENVPSGELDDGQLTLLDENITPPQNNVGIRRFGIEPPTDQEIIDNLDLQDLLNSDSITTDGRTSSAARGRDTSPMKELWAETTSQEFYTFVEQWRNEQNIQNAVEFFQPSAAVQASRKQKAIREIPRYRSAVQARLELIRNHYIFLREVIQRYFLDNTTALSQLGIGANQSNLSPQEQALIGTSTNVNLITALELKALRQIDQEPFFVDELHIHRVPSQIILQESVSEKRPDFVRLDITGKVDFTDLDRVTSNFFLWAGGVDYDLWRTYGWAQQSEERAFIHDRLVAKQYCSAMLARQKARILSGTVTVRGDSKYRVGDCVFMEDQFMYFYITQISHNFSYGDFTTTLTLEYARRPDDFIAHPFDVIGSMLVNAHESEVAEAFGLGGEPGVDAPSKFTRSQQMFKQASEEQDEAIKAAISLRNAEVSQNQDTLTRFNK